jgi:hypothetical protein
MRKQAACNFKADKKFLIGHQLVKEGLLEIAPEVEGV